MNIKIIPLALIALSMQIGTGWAATSDGDETRVTEPLQCSVITTCSFTTVSVTLGKDCETYENVLIYRYCPDCARGDMDPITHVYESGPTKDCASAKSCLTCPSGYNLVEKETTPNDQLGCQYNNDDALSTFKYKYKTCIKDSCIGKTCTNCIEGYSPWTLADSNGLQTQTYTKCSCGICRTANTGRRCAAGFYGTGLADLETSGCTKCPTPGTSLAGSNEDISACHQSDGSDTTGSYIFTPTACYYSL